jgi:hypothetical protein
MKKVSAQILERYRLSQEDVELLFNWSIQLGTNSFDPSVLFYPRTVVCKASSGGDPIAFVPIQPVLMYESLAPKPGISELQTVLALYRFHQIGEQAAKEYGYGEMYFLTNSEGEMLASSKRGWVVSLYDPEKHTWLMKRRIPNT